MRKLWLGGWTKVVLVCLGSESGYHVVRTVLTSAYTLLTFIVNQVAINAAPVRIVFTSREFVGLGVYASNPLRETSAVCRARNRHSAEIHVLTCAFFLHKLCPLELRSCESMVHQLATSWFIFSRLYFGAYGQDGSRGTSVALRPCVSTIHP